MCGLAGAFSLTGAPIPRLTEFLAASNHLQAHRGPDGEGAWWSADSRCGFSHRRLSIIGLGDQGLQPMPGPDGSWLTFNGEIYNYRELRDELGEHRFRTTTDSETLLVGYESWGDAMIEHLRGMFAFGLYDAGADRLVVGRDRLGIKPLCYTVVDGCLYFASEAKALLPVLPEVRTSPNALRDYLTFQFCLGGKTLFEGINELAAGHLLVVEGGSVTVRKYWDIDFVIDEDSSEAELDRRLEELLVESTDLHLRADVPVGGYVSGGLDSSLVAALASEQHDAEVMGFVGKFTDSPEFDESHHARSVAEHCGFTLIERDIVEQDFLDNARAVIRHLDYPLAGPGAFPQYMISQTAAEHRKVVLGGQGGDELFGGYVRYLVAYFEAAIKGAIDGTLKDRDFIVTYDTILPSLPALDGYQPMLQDFWREGLFGPPEERYFRLVDRSRGIDGDVVKIEVNTPQYSPYESFLEVFTSPAIHGASYFDAMTHFDFKTLLPALLHVEDRMSMAHGLEARVPLLDHRLVEFSATIPARTKFRGGSLKKVLREASSGRLPTDVLDRKDKMGFPVPLAPWLGGRTGDFVRDVFENAAGIGRDEINYQLLFEQASTSLTYSRSLWGYLSLALWYEEFHDRAAEYRQLLEREWPIANVADQHLR
jgi:asparagine synthase (glutamine-hydrolysing)